MAIADSDPTTPPADPTLAAATPHSETGWRPPTVEQVWNSPSVFTSDGSINRDGVKQWLLTSGLGHLLPLVTTTIDILEATRAKLLREQRLLGESQRNAQRQDARQLAAAQFEPGIFHLIVADRARVGLISRDQATDWLGLVDPAAIQAIAAQWQAATPASEPAGPYTTDCALTADEFQAAQTLVARGMTYFPDPRRRRGC